MKPFLKLFAAILLATIWLANAGPLDAAFAPFQVGRTATPVAPTVTVTPTACASPTVGVSCAGFAGNATGTPTPTAGYVWRSAASTCTVASSAISGATSLNYSPVTGDIGNVLCLTVTWTNTAGTAVATTPQTGAVAASGGSSVAFSLPTGSTLKYMAPTGNDACNGTSPTIGSSGACAWATPNHAMNCGEVIVASTSTAYPNYQSFGTVSNCPSTSGGIDGTGGVYFASIVCASTLTTCENLQTTGGYAFRINASNWAVEGFYVNSGGNNRAYEGNGCLAGVGGPGLIHDIAFINDVSANNLQAADTNDCGATHTTSVPSAAGVDYFFSVGLIAQNSAQDSVCLAAIDVVGPGVLDTNAGTHYYIYGNFAYSNANVGCRSISDTEDYMADTLDAHNVNTTVAFANNIGYNSDRMCIQTFWQQSVSDTPPIKIYNNTCFHNNNQTGTDNFDGEINIASTGGTNPWVITVQNNIAYQPLSASGGGHAIGAFAQYSNIASITFGGTGNENFMRANNSSCTLSFCNSTFDAQASQTGIVPGTNTYTNPALTNTTDLLANQAGIPNCSGFATTTACMGWNANTSTLTTPSVISDLVPTASGSTSKGYQQPSLTCGSTSITADYPSRIKGIVYLVWNGTSLTENAGLVQKPCGV